MAPGHILDTPVLRPYFNGGDECVWYSFFKLNHWSVQRQDFNNL